MKYNTWKNWLLHYRNVKDIPWCRKRILNGNLDLHKWLRTGLSWCFRWKEPAYKAEDLGSIPGLGRSPGKVNGNPFHILAWRIPWTEEPGGWQSMGSQRVGHTWATNAFLRLSTMRKIWNSSLIIFILTTDEMIIFHTYWLK